MEWVGLVMAPDETTAGMWCELLRNNNIPATPRLGGGSNYAGVVLGPLVSSECWVMVQEDDVERAAAILEPIVRGGRRRRRHRE
jgi:Putative prokaryotic signal transducing protein